MRRASGFRGVIGMSLIERKDYSCVFDCLPTRVSVVSSKAHDGGDTPKKIRINIH